MASDKRLLGGELRVINIGLKSFADELRRRGARVTHVDWQPPASGDDDMVDHLRRLRRDGGRTEQANQNAFQRIIDADPVLIDVAPAGEVMAGLRKCMLLHAGPPISWSDMCGPMRAAVVGALRYEGWAGNNTDAEAMVGQGDIQVRPNHDFDAVGPMTGIISPSMPVFVIENRTFGNKAYCTINEGIGKVMRFGANDDAVIERLVWLQEELAPLLREAIRRVGGVELGPILARALSMGDEMHQRNVAASSLFFRAVAPDLARTSTNGAELARAMEFLATNDQFFLNLAMAAAKAIMDPTGNISGSTIVSAMSRNGKDFGIRVGGTGSRWFTTPAPMPDGMYFPGYTAADANPDMGDSAIIETVGLGGFAMAGAPAVVGFVGAGTFENAIKFTREMGEITFGRHTQLRIPTLDFQGTPCGIDVLKVVETGITPVINTGIAHRQPGVGQVGAGIVRAPFECFTQALEALAGSAEIAGKP